MTDGLSYTSDPGLVYSSAVLANERSSTSARRRAPAPSAAEEYTGAGSPVYDMPLAILQPTQTGRMDMSS
jgi:hypothetical protein